MLDQNQVVSPVNAVGSADAKYVLPNGTVVSTGVGVHYADGKADLYLSLSGTELENFLNFPGATEVSGSVSFKLNGVSYGNSPSQWYLSTETPA